MFKLLLALYGMTFVAALPSASAASGGDSAGNGGGILEQNFRFALESLPWLVRNCLSKPDCVSLGPERELLSRIARDLPREQRSARPLIFDSGTAHPERFQIDGAMRVAVTGDRVGDPIYLNLDMLYYSGPSRISLPLDVGAAAAILTHEFGHHQGAYHGPDAERFLDGVGAKVRAFANLEMERFKADTWAQGPDRGSKIEILAFHTYQTSFAPVLRGAHTTLLLSDGGRSYSLDEEIAAKLTCPAKAGDPGALQGYRFHSMGWEPIRALPVDGKISQLQFNAPLFLHCRYPGPPVSFQTDFKARLTFSFEFSSDRLAERRYRYIEGSLQILLEKMESPR